MEEMYCALKHHRQSRI